MDLSQWLEYIQRQHPESIELGLDRVREVATRLGLGRPAAQVITVAGTNGKGSTVAFIEAIAGAGGWKVGAYTSPHLLRYNERVRIEAEEVADDALVAAFAVVEAARVDTPLTYFEFGTLAALWLFQRASLDLVVLEVGLGGRLDAVNLVDADVAVVTTVDIDHTGWLGSDRESIGREKAGIARAWKPLVLGEVDPPSSVLRHAYAIGANAIRLGSDFFHEPVDAAHWRWREVGAELRLPAPRLAAPPQRANASTAIAALRALPRALPEAAFAQGVATATLPGRLQCLQRDGVEIVLDVAHNPQAARELAAWLRRRSPAPTVAVFAALADKDAAGMVQALAGQVGHWYLAGLEQAGRGQDVEHLVARLDGTVAGVATGVSSGDARVADALARAIAAASPAGRVLVFGSFHTVAEALQALRSGH
ncbi:MAG: bifunctional tetrahydrofolate synthase/dihydrofolate synthase [Pseudoxanthomonas sp.]|nr:bifunctional tetrahydrofolate synthase/dihydrofolate synthase [Pseudoxanthomonas sp.]